MPLGLNRNNIKRYQESDPTTALFFLVLILLVILSGVFGYSYIEGWSYFDSLYMTIITLATIGYGETHPLTHEGRVFTLILIVLGVGLFALLFSTVTQYLFQRQFLSNFKEKRMLETIKNFKEHTIFCGYGRLARTAAVELREAGINLVIIERDPVRSEEAEKAGYLVLRGDATLEETLILAGVARAKRLISLLPKDSDNLYAILTSRELNNNLFILTYAEDDTGEKRLKRAGANRVISPYRIGGHKIAEGIMRPYVTDFLDLAVSSSHKGLQIEEISIPDESPVKGQTLKEASLRQKTNVMVAAIVSGSGDMIFNPDSNTTIDGGATFIAIGVKSDLRKLEELLTGVVT